MYWIPIHEKYIFDINIHIYEIHVCVSKGKCTDKRECEYLTIDSPHSHTNNAITKQTCFTRRDLNQRFLRTKDTQATLGWS